MDKFIDPLTPDDLYWIGYIRADGSLCESRGTPILSFSQAQIEPVEALKSYLDLPNKISSRSVVGKSFGTGYKHLIRSVKPANRLVELGVKGKLRSDIYNSTDFWRGFCDGDGSISTWHKPPYKYPAIGFCGSYEDMLALSCWALNNFGYGLSIGRAKSIYKVQTTGKKALQIIKRLYENRYSANHIKSAKAKEWFND